MTGVDLAERIVRLGAVVLAGLALFGSARGAASGALVAQGSGSGLARRLRAHVVYLIGAVPYFACCALLWRRIPVTPGPGARIALLAGGTVAGLAGAALYLGGRRTLGPMYNVSSALGSELYEDQRLVANGLYGRVRHPMYLGLLVAGIGALAVFRTWTFVFVLGSSPLIVLKARREERLLAARFGAAWDAYAARVPAWIPRPRKEVDRVDTPTLAR